MNRSALDLMHMLNGTPRHHWTASSRIAARPDPRSRPRRRFAPLARAGFACLALVLYSAQAAAHELGIAPIRITISADRSSYAVDVPFDLDAAALGLPASHVTAEDYAAEHSLPPEERQQLTDDLLRIARRSFTVRVDGQALPAEIAFPELDHAVTGDAANRQDGVASDPLWGKLLRLRGSVPAGSKSLTLWTSRTFGPANVLAAIADDDPHFSQLLPAGQETGPISLTGLGGAERFARTSLRYLVFGYEHILPKGLDHILFVVGLFLLSPGVRPLLWQVTAFTAAHTITLALSMFEVVSLSPAIVEPLIALSIAFVALENTLTSRLHAWRPVVVFGFGLLHGMGFAGVLTELGLPRRQFVTALVSFNVGVELGQLSVIGLALLVTIWWRGQSWYRARVVIPASLLIAMVGLYWAVQRTFA